MNDRPSAEELGYDPRNYELLQQYRRINPAYNDSYTAAGCQIETLMSAYQPAWKFPQSLPYMEGNLLEQQLMIAEICPKTETKRLFRDTATRLLPFGRVAAHAYYYKPERAYVLLDTGALDFFGNMSALLFAVFEQNNGINDYELEEQALVSKFWGLALQYYDFGFKTNQEALIFPHFRFNRLKPPADLYARYVAMTAFNFFIYHEYGHLVDGMLGDQTGGPEDEFSADLFAFTAIRESVFQTNAGDANTIQTMVIGCLFSLATMNFIETTFPGLSISRGGETITFPARDTRHPSPQARLERLLATFPPPIVQDLQSLGIYTTMQRTYQQYSDLIRKGARPSKPYWDFQDWLLQQYRDGKTV